MWSLPFFRGRECAIFNHFLRVLFAGGDHALRTTGLEELALFLAEAPKRKTSPGCELRVGRGWGHWRMSGSADMKVT